MTSPNRLKFLPQFDLTFPLFKTPYDPARADTLLANTLEEFLRARDTNEHNEAGLQEFFTILNRFALGRLDEASMREARIKPQSGTDLSRLLEDFNTFRLPARLIKWRDETKALDVHSSSNSSRSSRSSTSRSGVRVPDVTVALHLPNHGNKTLVLHVVELKVDRNNRPTQWRAGMAQAILYLAQSHDAHGTTMGTFMLDTSFTRLHAADRTIYLEIADTMATGPPLTIQELFAQAETMAAGMPHDIAPRNGQGVDAEGLHREDMLLLYHHLGRVRHLVEQIDLSGPLDRLPAANPALNRSVQLPHVLGQPANDIIGLSDLDLLELAQAAHPKTFPQWWVDAKKENVKEGRPDDTVSRTARPRRNTQHATHRSRSTAGSGATRTRKRGTELSSGGGAGAARRGCAGGRPTGRAAAAGESGGGGGGDGGGGGGDVLPDTRGEQTMRPISPPYGNDEEEAGADAHRARWLRQQAHVSEYLPVSVPPATPDTSPTGKGKGVIGVGTSDVKLYSTDSPMLANPSMISLQRDSDSDSDSGDHDLDEETLTRLAAQFTLAGWRIQLVSSDMLDDVLAGGVGGVLGIIDGRTD